MTRDNLANRLRTVLNDPIIRARLTEDQANALAESANRLESIDQHGLGRRHP
jgi:hypothetical protein